MVKNNLLIFNSLFKVLFCLAFCVLSIISKAQEVPPIQYYSPKQYDAQNQNWDISQSSNKYIYVANSKGLLEFNGAEWMLYPSPNETIIRSVEVVEDKIYTGSYREFGYWSKTNVGKLIYTSLSRKIKDAILEDEQFWKILNLDNWLLFQSLNRIYIYNTKTETFKIINTDVALLKMFKVNKTIYYQDASKGLMMLENGVSKLVSDDTLYIKNTIVGIYTFQDKLITITQNKGVFTLENGQPKVWLSNLNTKLSKYSIYSCKQFEDGSFVLGTISNGIIRLSLEGDITHTINQSQGLGNNTVLSVFEDEDNNMWLGLDNGINCINMKSPFMIFQDDKGTLGTVYNAVLFEDNLYLGTNQGLFYKPVYETEFKYIQNTKGQVWHLRIIDNQLFCGHNSGTYLIKNNTATQIASLEGTWEIKPVKNQQNLLIQGNFNGLNVLEKKNNQWVFRNKIDGFDISSRFFVFSKENEILVNHEYKGVYKILLNDDYTKAISVSKIEGLDKGVFSSIEEYNNNIYYANRLGVFKKNKNDASFVKDSVLSNLITEQGFSSGKLIVNKESNTLWIVTQKGVNYITPGKLTTTPDISFVPLPSSLRAGISGFESVFNIASNNYLLGNSKGYITLDLSKMQSKEYQININSINEFSIEGSKNPIDLNSEGEFKNKHNNIEFTYSVAEFDKFLEVEYSFKLEGIYDNWSSWSNKPNVLHENLPYGDYVFKVKARVGNYNIPDHAAYAFSIKKPWYLSNLMVLLYIISGLFLIILTNYFYKRYYRKQKEKLLQKAQRDLELKDLEIKQQLMALKNEKLSQEVESKSRELAISTMSLIKKNEFLNTIKTELNNKVGDNNLKSVIKIIDKNINNKDDWNLFQEAFNNADKDFLKKVKTKHSALTSNDLRLCAYLRLNLSSKEIAPLLNISPRSVEVKRYRLRKKMNLPHEVNLADYILEI